MMKKYRIFSTIATAVIATAAQAETAAPDGYTLEKTVIVSRHGIRAPIARYTKTLTESTPQTWPAWQTEDGELTPHGGERETRIAHYVRRWLDDAGITSQGSCPAQGEVLIYTNSAKRTIDTGKNFAKGAFPGCDIPVRHLEEAGKMDDTFHAIIRSPVDDAFTAKAGKSIDDMVGAGGLAGVNERLAKNYQLLEDVLDYKHSVACEKEKQCEFSKITNTLHLTQNKKPAIKGSLQSASSIISSFILQYYENYPEKDVAWGKLKTAEEWQTVMEIKNTEISLTYASPFIAKEAASPLLTFIQNSFADHGYNHPYIKEAQKARTVLLVGHNSNIASLLGLLGTAPYELPEQYEKIPVSGKVIFEKWRDKDGKAWMKMEYLYQSAQQLRENSESEEKNLPRRITLKLADCPTSADDYCPMEAFDYIVSDALKRQ